MLKIVMAIALLWSAYWYGAGYVVQRGITAWFQAREAENWQAEFADISTSGYPLRHITLLSSPALADPATGAAWQADWLMLDNPAIWPGKQTIRFPPAMQRLSYFDQTVELTAEAMVADLHLVPGPALEIDRLALSSGPWLTAAEGSPIFAGQSLDMSMQSTDAPATYAFNILAPEFALDDSLRRTIGSAAALPDSFQSLELDMTVQFDRPWDRRALEERRPQPVAIDLGLARAEWGALSLFAAGEVTVDAAGVPTGSVTFKAENWQDMLEIARQSGAVPEYTLAPAEQILGLLSRISGNREALDVELTLADGRVSLGPFPIGPAPILRLR